MKKKLMTTCALSSLILAVNSIAKANITDVDMVDSSDGQPNTYFLPLKRRAKYSVIYCFALNELDKKSAKRLELTRRFEYFS